MDNEYYQEIIEKIKELPSKKEFLPGIYAVPMNVSPSMKEYIHTKIITRMCKPLQTVFKMYNLNWRSIISIFSTVDVEIQLWELYDVNKFKRKISKDPNFLDIYSMMNEEINLNKLFANDENDEISFENDEDVDEENNVNINLMMPKQNNKVEKYLKYNSCVKITDKKAAVIHVDFYKDCGIDPKTFLDNLVINERYTLLAIYLNELVSFLTRVYKYENAVTNYVKLNLHKLNKSVKKKEIPNEVYDEIKEAIVKCFNSYLLNKNIINSLSNSHSNLFKNFLENPFSFSLPENSELYNYKNNDTLTILEIAEYICKKAEFIFEDFENEDGINESELVGMKLLNNIYIISKSIGSGNKGDGQGNDSRSNDLNDAFESTIGKMRGFGCKDVLSALGCPIETEVDWVENILKKIVTTYQNKSSKIEFTWSKPNILTKHITNLPSALKYGLNIKVHYSIDSSGSMENEDLEKSNFIIKYLVERNIPMVIYVHDYGDDVKVFECNNLQDFETFSKYRYRSGGTSHEGVFKRIEENLKNFSERKKAIVVVFSDLYSDINECYNKFNWTKIAPTFFVTRSHHMNPCFGETIVIH